MGFTRRRIGLHGAEGDSEDVSFQDMIHVLSKRNNPTIAVKILAKGEPLVDEGFLYIYHDNSREADGESLHKFDNVTQARAWIDVDGRVCSEFVTPKAVDKVLFSGLITK